MASSVAATEGMGRSQPAAFRDACNHLDTFLKRKGFVKNGAVRIVHQRQDADGMWIVRVNCPAAKQ